MRAVSSVFVLASLAVLATCSIEHVEFQLPNVGTCPADPNGLPDCNDPACASAPACEQPKVECGDGMRGGSEECDDGNATNGDDCENDCTLPKCGNGIKDRNEACDDGNATNGDACNNNCTLPTCGDGVRDTGEECDDGNSVNGDTCENNCTLPTCGNGIKDANEQCDDGNVMNGDACNADCTLPLRNYTCGYAVKDNGCDNFRSSLAVQSNNMTTAIAACQAKLPSSSHDQCYVLDASGAAATDQAQCESGGGSWRPKNACCNFLGTLSCPP